MSLKLCGSKVAKIQCLKCKALSPPFRVTLRREDATDEVGEFIWKETDFPKGWAIPDDEGLYDDIVYGYCPEHSEDISRDQIV